MLYPFRNTPTPSDNFKSVARINWGKCQSVFAYFLHHSFGMLLQLLHATNNDDNNNTKKTKSFTEKQSFPYRRRRGNWVERKMFNIFAYERVKQSPTKPHMLGACGHSSIIKYVWWAPCCAWAIKSRQCAKQNGGSRVWRQKLLFCCCRKVDSNKTACMQQQQQQPQHRAYQTLRYKRASRALGAMPKEVMWHAKCVALKFDYVICVFVCVWGAPTVEDTAPFAVFERFRPKICRIFVSPPFPRVTEQTSPVNVATFNAQHNCIWENGFIAPSSDDLPSTTDASGLFVVV